MSFSPLQYIQTRAPEFASDPALTTLISMAALETGNYGSVDLTNKAIALLVCHWSSLKSREGESGVGSSGAIRSESEGQLSRSYGSTGNAAFSRGADLEQTRWGLELLDLRKSSFFLPRTSRMTTNDTLAND